MPSTDILEIASNLREFTRKDVEVNWTTADAVVRSRECLCESLCTVWKKWQALAAKNGWSVERLACSPKLDPVAMRVGGA